MIPRGGKQQKRFGSNFLGVRERGIAQVPDPQRTACSSPMSVCGKRRRGTGQDAPWLQMASFDSLPWLSRLPPTLK